MGNPSKKSYERRRLLLPPKSHYKTAKVELKARLIQIVPTTHYQIRSLPNSKWIVAMSLLRLYCCFPSTSYLYTEPQQQQSHGAPFVSLLQKQQKQHYNYFFPLSSSPFHAYTFPITPKKVSPFVFHFSATTQDPFVGSSSAAAANTEQREEEYSKTRLVAQNVPWTSTHEDIRALFEQHGTVLDVELSMHSKNRNRGLAFVTMGSPDEATAALNNLESYEFEGRTLKVNYAKIKKKNPAPPVQPKPFPTFNLFIANLSFEARAKDLREFFISEGWDVVAAEVIFHDNPRRSAGYGFVSFKSKKVAEAAISAFQGKLFMGRPLRVAPSRQFARLQTKEGLHSDETSDDLNINAEEADTADGS
ncbi:hypothetical protein AB3S75_011867 [Citrus x aurantiifolia]